MGGLRARLTVAAPRAPQRDGGCAIWKAHMLLPGRGRDARFTQTIVVRRAGELLQRRGARNEHDEMWRLPEPVSRGGPILMGGYEAVGRSLSQH